MKLEGKDLLSITGLHRFVEDRLGGFTIEQDEMTRLGAFRLDRGAS